MSPATTARPSHALERVYWTEAESSLRELEKIPPESMSWNQSDAEASPSTATTFTSPRR